MIDIYAHSGMAVNLGRVGENQARRVIFDVTNWNAKYPGATITLLNEPPGATDAYPVQNVTVDGDNVYWIIESADVPKYGCGRCELIATQDEVIVKSEIYGTVTQRALDDTGEAPEPWESWQTVFAGLKDEAVSAAENAEAASEAVQDMGVEAETLEPGSAATVIKTVDPDTGAVTLIFGVPAGESGQTPDLTIGTVSTLPAGSDATATITGTPDEPVLNLGIPQGEKGDPGDGVPTGGTTGQMLVKATDADYDAEWVDPPEGEVTQAEFDALKQYVYDMSPVTTVTAPVVSVSDAAPLDAEGLVVDIEPVQEGSGDPSPDNVRPISGWTGAKVTRTGVNVLNLSEWEYESNSGITIGTDDISVINNGYQEKLNRYNVLNRSACVFSFHVKTVALSDSRASFAVYTDGRAKLQGSGTTGVGNITLDSVGTEKDITLTVPNGTEYISFGGWAWGGEVQISNLQLELGSTATDYEPYQGDIFSITFPTEAGTVYGGTVDLTRGKLVVDRAMVDLGTLTWNKISTSNSHWRFWGILNTMNIPGEMLSSQYRQITASEQYIGAQGIANQKSGSNMLAMVSDERYTDATTFKTAMNGVQLVYELATPITYDLTPQEIEMFKGVNNLWANTGDISVQYRQDVYTALNNKINALEALVLENMN